MATLRLHIGGESAKAGWTILNIAPGPHVDVVGSCTDLSMFKSGAVAEVYASHVLEHLGYVDELPRALAEIYRILEPGGIVRISVPDLMTLCAQLLSPEFGTAERFRLMRFMFGGQEDAHDFHKVGLTDEFLAMFLGRVGFSDIKRVSSFGLFEDYSQMRFRGVPISLNMQARKP